MVEIELPYRAFAFFDPAKRKFVVEVGEFEVYMGTSSDDKKAYKITVCLHT